MASSSIATARPLHRDGASADRIQKPANDTKGNAITKPAKGRGQVREYLVVSGSEVVYSSASFGNAWAFRNGWGTADAVLATVLLAQGETLPVDVSDDPDNCGNDHGNDSDC